MASSAVEQVVKSELEHYPGVELELKDGRKHDKAVFHFQNRSRFLTLPKSPSDWRATENIRRDLKKTLEELGVERLRYRPGTRDNMKRRKRARAVAPWVARGPGSHGGPGRRTRNALAAFAVNKYDIVVTIPYKSPLVRHFKDDEGKPLAHWTMELLASPNLHAPPKLVLKRVELPPGKERQQGVTTGWPVNKGAWAIKIARRSFPALANKVKDKISSIDLNLNEERGDRLIFDLPEGTFPTSYQPHHDPVEAEEPPAPLPSQAWPERPEEPAEEPPATEVAKVTPEPQAGYQDRPIVLQMPKQTVSVEQAIALLNKRKAQLGNLLRFTVEEGGFLSAVHRIGK